MSATPTAKDSDKYIIRLPDGLRTFIKVRAANNRRTMNAEILVLIERALADEKKDVTQ